MRLNLIIYFLTGFALLSCRDNKEAGSKTILTQDQVTEKLLEGNKAAIEFENEQINKFVLRNGWNMVETGTGLRYQIIEKGKGIKTSVGKRVKFEYEVKLLNGDVIYSSDKTGMKEFMTGSGGVESGLEEGMLLLNVGDKARFIIPSYLAHGLSGDQDQVPAKSTLIYTVKLIDLK
jgi:FKBP-type peptidyl-prolyl cis-trans isomerase FkpA